MPASAERTEKAMAGMSPAEARQRIEEEGAKEAQKLTGLRIEDFCSSPAHALMAAQDRALKVLDLQILLSADIKLSAETQASLAETLHKTKRAMREAVYEMGESTNNYKTILEDAKKLTGEHAEMIKRQFQIIKHKDAQLEEQKKLLAQQQSQIRSIAEAVAEAVKVKNQGVQPLKKSKFSRIFGILFKGE